QQHRERILRDADVPALAQPMAQMLQELETELEARYETVNRRILSGENTQIKLKQKNGETLWTLPYPSGEDRGKTREAAIRPNRHPRISKDRVLSRVKIRRSKPRIQLPRGYLQLLGPPDFPKQPEPAILTLFCPINRDAKGKIAKECLCQTQKGKFGAAIRMS